MDEIEKWVEEQARVLNPKEIYWCRKQWKDYVYR
jgi:hypothetical protein